MQLVLASIGFVMAKKNDAASDALRRAAQAAQKAMRSHGYDVPVEKFVAAYTATAASEAGSSAGGIARAQNLTPERRSEIARQAANKRWANNEEPIDE